MKKLIFLLLSASCVSTLLWSNNNNYIPCFFKTNGTASTSCYGMPYNLNTAVVALGLTTYVAYEANKSLTTYLEDQKPMTQARHRILKLGVGLNLASTLLVLEKISSYLSCATHDKAFVWAATGISSATLMSLYYFVIPKKRFEIAYNAGLDLLNKDDINTFIIFYNTNKFFFNNPKNKDDKRSSKNFRTRNYSYLLEDLEKMGKKYSYQLLPNDDPQNDYQENYDAQKDGLSYLKQHLKKIKNVEKELKRVDFYQKNLNQMLIEKMNDHSKKINEIITFILS